MSLNLINFAIYSDKYVSILYGITLNIYVVISGKDNVLKAISKIRKLKHLNANLFSKQEKSIRQFFNLKLYGNSFLKIYIIYNFYYFYYLILIYLSYEKWSVVHVI